MSKAFKLRIDRTCGNERELSQGSHSHILMTGGGPKDSFGSDILAKRDFFGSMKDAGIFLGRENKRGIFLGYCIFHQLK